MSVLYVQKIITDLSYENCTTISCYRMDILNKFANNIDFMKETGVLILGNTRIKEIS